MSCFLRPAASKVPLTRPYLLLHNAKPRPFIWSKTADDIIARERRALDALDGWCQTNANQSQFAQTRSVSGRAELTPLCESGGATGLEIVPAGEGALSVEVVVD